MANYDSYRVLDRFKECARIKFRAKLPNNPPPIVVGDGYLAGEPPNGLTTVAGVPESAEVRVLLRCAGRHDGALVAKTVSSNTGQWRIDGLDPDLKYDVVGRQDGF